MACILFSFSIFSGIVIFPLVTSLCIGFTVLGLFSQVGPITFETKFQPHLVWDLEKVRVFITKLLVY